MGSWGHGIFKIDRDTLELELIAEHWDTSD